MEQRQPTQIQGPGRLSDIVVVDHRESSSNSEPSVINTRIGSIAISGGKASADFFEKCPVDPTPAQTAEMLRNQLNPHAGAAVQKFQERSKEF